MADDTISRPPSEWAAATWLDFYRRGGLELVIVERDTQRARAEAAEEKVAELEARLRGASDRVHQLESLSHETWAQHQRDLSAARRGAEELADQVRTVADEETGPHPVISAAEAMKHISKALFERRVRIEKLEAQETQAVRQIGEIDERLNGVKADVLALVDQRDAARREAEELRMALCQSQDIAIKSQAALGDAVARVDRLERQVAAHQKRLWPNGEGP